MLISEGYVLEGAIHKLKDFQSKTAKIVKGTQKLYHGRKQWKELAMFNMESRKYKGDITAVATYLEGFHMGKRLDILWNFQEPKRITDFIPV